MYVQVSRECKYIPRNDIDQQQSPHNRHLSRYPVILERSDNLRLPLTRAVPANRRLITIVVSIVHHARMISIVADVDQGCGIAVVGVDASKSATVHCCYALDVDVALALGAALLSDRLTVLRENIPNVSIMEIDSK